MACRRRRLPGSPPPTNVMPISLPLGVTFAMVVAVAVAPTTLAIAAAFRGTDAVAAWSGPVTGFGFDGVRGRDISRAVGARPLVGDGGGCGGGGGEDERGRPCVRGDGPESERGRRGCVRWPNEEDRGGRDLRVGIIDDVVERDKDREEASGGEGAAELESDVSSGDANVTEESVFVDVELPPFSLVLALDVPAAEYPSGGGDNNSSVPNVTVETARNDGGEDEQSSTAVELNHNHTIMEEVETLTEIYLQNQLSVLLAQILPPSVVIEDVVLNITSVEVLPPSADDDAARQRRRVLRTWLVTKAANDDEEEKGEGELASLRIKLYFEGIVRFSVPIPSSSSNSTAITDTLPSDATLRRALQTALRRALRTSLSGSNLNDPEDDGSLLNLLRNGGIENSEEVEGDEASDANGDTAAIELSTVTEITGRLEAPPQPPRPLPPGPVSPPPSPSPSPVGGVDDGIDDTNTTVGDDGGADDEQPPLRPEPPSQGDGDSANGNSTNEEDGGPSQGGGTTSGGSNATSVGTDEGEKEEREPIAEESGGPVSGGANITDTDTNTTDGNEEDGDEEGEQEQEQSGNNTTIIGGGGNSTVNGTIGDGDVELEDPSGGDDASTGSPSQEDGGGTAMSAGIIAVVTMASVAVVGELFILSVSAYRGRSRLKMSPPAAGGVEGEDSNDHTIMKVHVAGGDVAGRGGAAEEQRPGGSFDTFDSDATGNTIDVAAPLEAVAASGHGGVGDDGPVEGKNKLAHYDVSGAVAYLDGGLDHDLGDVGGGVEGGQSDVEMGGGSASSAVETVEKDADVVEDSPQDDGSTKLSSSDERTHGANDDDVEKEDRVEEDDVVVSLNESGGPERVHVSEKVEDGMSGDTSAADRGIEFEAAPASALAGAVSPAAAATSESMELHADNKEEEVVGGTIKHPFVDAIPGGEHDPSVRENAPVSLEETSINCGASDGHRDDVTGCESSSSSSPFEQVCQSTSSGASPQEEDGTDVTAMDTVTDTKRAMASDDNPDDDVFDAGDTMADSAVETTHAVQRSSSLLPAAPRPQEPRRQPLAEPEATGTGDGDASHRSDKSSSWSLHASNDVSSAHSSDGAASPLQEASENETETKAREMSEGERRFEEKRPAMAVKRTLSQLSPQRLVRKAKLLRKSSTSSSIGKTSLAVDDKKDADCPVDTSRPDDDDSSSGYVDSSVGGAPSDHHKDRHVTHHHGEDSSFDDNSYAFSEGSLAWSYDKVAHPSCLPRAAANDTSVSSDAKDAALNPSEPLPQSNPSLMVDLAEFV